MELYGFGWTSQAREQKNQHNGEECKKCSEDAPNDGREDGARGIIAGEASLAHTCTHEQTERIRNK